MAEKVLGKEAAAGKRGHLHLGLEGQNIERVFCLICFFPGLPDESTATGVNTRLGRVGVRPLEWGSRCKKTRSNFRWLLTVVYRLSDR